MKHMERNKAKEYREKQKLSHMGLKAQLTREKKKQNKNIPQFQTIKDLQKKSQLQQFRLAIQISPSFKHHQFTPTQSRLSLETELDSV